MTPSFRPAWALALSLGMLLGASGCPVSPTPACTPSNCTGCCDANDQCQLGTTQTVCGAGGNACDVCVSSQVCQLGRCAASVTTGGGAGGGGGATGGGAGGGGGNALTCNASGIGAGCTAASPFTCDAATKCYVTYAGCASSTECGGAGGGGGTGGGGGAVGGGTGGGGGGGTGGRTVTGRVTYDFVPSRYVQGQGGNLYFNQTVARPVRNAVVRVVESGTTVLATGNTAEDGTYSLSFTAGPGALQVQVLARTSTPPIQVEDNTSQNVTWGFGGALAAGVTTLDLRATHGWTGSSYGGSRQAAPFAILDSMYTASKAFMAVRTVTFPALKVNWSPNNAPQAGDKTLGQIGTSHFAPRENEIYVLGLAGADTDEFDSHVIVHEWGHYFEANLSRSDSPGGPHGGGDVLDPRIAFGEAWGTAVAAMVLPETMYTDSMWSNGTLGAWGYDAETIPNPTDDPTPNAFSENSMLRAIYDLYDSTSDGAFDQVGVGLGTVYDVLTGPERQTDALTTLASFVTGLKAQAGANPTGIDAVLAHYNVGPVSSDFGAGDTNLAGMFTAAAIPFNGNIGLGGGFPANSYEQNQYYVFTGTGRSVIVTANAAQDVGITAYRKGVPVGYADTTTTGTETFTFGSQANVIYVVVLQGFGQVAGNYNVTLTITSP